MTQKYVPIEKQSKKAQREYYSQQRLDWGTVNPVSREFENNKGFNKAVRSRTKDELKKRQSSWRRLE